MRHRGDIRLEHEVVGKVGLDIDQLQARDSRSAGRAEEPAGTRDDGEVRARLRCPELPTDRGWKHLHQLPVPLCRIEARSVEEPSRPIPTRPRLGARGWKESDPACGSGRDGVREAAKALGERVGPVALVSTEDLVASVTRERHRDEAAGVLADEERREGGRVAERLVVGLDEAWEQRGRVRLEQQLLVDRAVALGDEPCVPSFVVALILEADRERADGLGALLRHGRDDDAGVDSARQESSEGHVRDEPLADGVADAVPDGFDPLPVASGHSGGRLEAPVPLCPDNPALGDEQVPWLEPMDSRRVPSPLPGRSRVRGRRRAVPG